jgi:polyisoprenyl-phosphate glycosyltransferase
MRVSVVIPCYRSTAALTRLVTELFEILAPHDSVEIVLVSDCPPDDGATWRIITELVKTHDGQPKKSVIGVDLALNSGEHNAVLAGLRHTTGDAVVVMDDDGQNPPSAVPELLAHLTENVDVVYSTFPEKKHNMFRNLGSRFTNWVAGILMDKPKGLYLSSFKVMHRRLVDRIAEYPGSFPYIDGLVFRNTRRYAVVTVEHLARQDGRSGYSFTKLMKLYTNMAFGFSILPLRVLTFSGMAIAIAAMIAALIFVADYFISGSVVQGWTSLSVLVIFFGGLTLLALGILGEYFGRMYLTMTGKQPYVVNQTIGDRTHHEVKSAEPAMSPVHAQPPPAQQAANDRS